MFGVSDWKYSKIKITWNLNCDILVKLTDQRLNAYCSRAWEIQIYIILFVAHYNMNDIEEYLIHKFVLY